MWKSGFSNVSSLVRRFSSVGAVKKLKPVTFDIPNHISVGKLANLLNIRSNKLVNDLNGLGFSKVDHRYLLSKEYVELILGEYGYKVKEHSNQFNTSDTIYEQLREKPGGKLVNRPPIVTIIGHIDHGKTTIIDYLRKSSIVDKEHGGITQHIGAFQIETPITHKKITFLDTPGHAAFLKMRERGATVTDIIILVVSIEDSIMPQTIEAINHYKSSGNQLIVAITKIDKFKNNQKERAKKLEKITNDLIQHGIEVEKIGGDVQVIPISAKTGENMELLEEAIITLSDVMDIKTENKKATQVEGYIIESQLTKMVGNTATVLLKKGTLQKGDILLCGQTYCKVRSILNDRQKSIPKALPSEAVTVLGWKDLPDMGEEVLQVKNESVAKKFISKRLALLQEEEQARLLEELNAPKEQSEAGKETSYKAEEDITPKKINFIVKADVSGSLEAIKDSIAYLGNEEVQCHIVSSSVGIPTESDMNMAHITNSTILCFNIPLLPSSIVNNKKNIDVKQYNVIYKLIEDVTQILTDNLKPIYEKKVVGTVEIREIFEFTVKKKIVKVAGCRVVNGKISRNSKVQIVRGPKKEIVYDGELASIKQGKEDVPDVSKGKECGIVFAGNYEDYKEGDVIEVYDSIKVPRYL